ncbi:MAG: hydroxysqualene dehydroxylase HpnE [Candidatus Bipolaricaulia bacterium]
MKVLILGGGLAGLTAGCALAAQGEVSCELTLIERRPYLGGRASSFFHKGLGEEIDLGQHVFLRCCSAYIAFLEKIGARELVKLQPHLSIKVRSRDGRVGLIRGSSLPGPLSLLPSFLRYPFLSFGEKAGLIPALAAASMADRARTKGSFSEWLAAHSQARRSSCQEFWDFLLLPTLNDHPENVSATMGLMVLQEAFLKGHGADLGYPRVGLSRLAAKAGDYIRERGGELILGKGAEALEVESGLVRAVRLSDGQLLEGDYFISALPPEGLLRILPEGWRAHPFFERAGRLAWNPIVNLYLWLDRPVLEEEVIAFWDSPVQWVFNRSKILGRPGPGQEGQELCLSLSGAWEAIALPPERLFQELSTELGRLLPEMREARIEKHLVVKQRRATISLRPGMEGHRLPSRTPIANLFLAGDWTDTGWPSTMEGAVRSGQAAARNLTAFLAGRTEEE